MTVSGAIMMNSLDVEIWAGFMMFLGWKLSGLATLLSEHQGCQIGLLLNMFGGFLESFQRKFISSCHCVPEKHKAFHEILCY